MTLPNMTPKYRLNAYHDGMMIERNFRSYTDISNDPLWNTIIRNKDHFYNIRKRNRPHQVTVTRLR